VIDRLVESTLRLEPDVDLYLVDEIGKMECLSKTFAARMNSVLDCGQPVIAAVAKKGEGFIGEVKSRRDSVLWEVTRQNRDVLPNSVLDWIAGCERRPKTQAR
jgi:nucleoside-triphosphatase